MQPLIMLMLFAGMAIVLHSIYDEKLKRAERQVKVEYRFLPRTLYEEQMEHTDVVGKFKGIFDRSSPFPGESSSLGSI